MAWIAILVVMTVVPLAFNLARSSGFAASVLLLPRAVEPYPPVTDPGAYRPFLSDPVLLAQMRLNVGSATSAMRSATFERPRPDVVRLTVVADTPAKAQRVVNALAAQVQGATQRQLAQLADREVTQVRARLATAVAGEERRALRRRLRRLETFGSYPPPRVLPGAPAPRPPLRRWADRVVDALPGDFYARPDPAWAASAGFLITAILFTAALVLRPPRRRG